MGLWRTDLPKPIAWPPRMDRASVMEAVRYARLRDPIGHKVHLALALLHCITLPLATMPSALTYGILIGYALLRLPHTWRSYVPMLRMPIVWLFTAWLAWVAASLLWTRNVAQGVEELDAMRVLLVPLALWPMLEYVHWLIAAALVGVLGQNAAQALELLDITNMRSQDKARSGGMIHPTQTGIWCTAALAWWLAAALRGRTMFRLCALAGLLFSGLGLIVSGSRGAWIATAGALPLMLIVEAMRRRSARKPAMLIAGLGIVFAAGAWVQFGDDVSDRITAAVEEYHRAQDEQDFRSDIGLRIALQRWGGEIWQEHPIFGAGAGSFRIEQAEQPSFQEALERWPDEMENLGRDHPHHTYLHALLTGGVIEGALVIGVLLLALIGAWRDPDDHCFADASFFIIIAWMIGGLFDCYQLNGHTFGLLMIAVATTLPLRATACCGACETSAPP